MTNIFKLIFYMATLTKSYFTIQEIKIKYKNVLN